MRAAAAAAALLVTLAVAGCQPTGTPRCDGLLQPQAEAAHALGGRLRCDPPGYFTWAPGATGWTDGATMTAWLRPDVIPSDDQLAMFAWHEDGHLWEHRTGRWVYDEARASEWGWCAGGYTLLGVGMPGWGPPPEGCAIFG